AIFAKNVRAKGVDLSRLDFVVLSHRHGDHTGGLSYLLEVNPKVRIYAPKDGLGGIFGSDIPSKFYRKDEALPAEQRYYGGEPPRINEIRHGLPQGQHSVDRQDHGAGPGHYVDCSGVGCARNERVEGVVTSHQHGGWHRVGSWVLA